MVFEASLAAVNAVSIVSEVDNLSGTLRSYHVKGEGRAHHQKHPLKTLDYRQVGVSPLLAVLFFRWSGGASASFRDGSWSRLTAPLSLPGVALELVFESPGPFCLWFLFHHPPGC